MRFRRSVSIIAAVLPIASTRFHPVHGARVELLAGRDGAIVCQVHVYRDDLSVAVAPASLSAYLNQVIILTDSRGSRVLLQVDSTVAEGDRLRIRLSGMSRSLAGGRAAVTLFQEHFSDQVNVLDAQVGGRRNQLVFLRGDGARPLP